jgi:hypothetical protein
VVNEIEKRGEEYDRQNTKSYVDYEGNRLRLVELVTEHGYENVATATDLKVSTIKQHCRNTGGTSMVSTYRIKRAEYALSEL